MTFGKKWTCTTNHFGKFIRKGLWWTKDISRITEWSQDAKLEVRKCHRLYMWTDSKVMEMDMSCLRFLNNSFYLCFRDCAKKLFILLSPKSPSSCTLVLALYEIQLTNLWAMGWGGAGWQERDEISGKKRRKLYWKKNVKKIASMFSPGLQKHMDFLMAQWQDSMQREWSTPQCPEHKSCEEDWNGSFQFKIC